jgi:single-stranded DNA-binding protein
MVNECILMGYISTKPERSKTKNGFEFCTSRLEVSEPRADGASWKTFLPVAGFGKQAEQLAQFRPGDLILIKGKIGWSQSDGLCITSRTVERVSFENVAEHDDAA